MRGSPYRTFPRHGGARPLKLRGRMTRVGSLARMSVTVISGHSRPRRRTSAFERSPGLVRWAFGE